MSDDRGSIDPTVDEAVDHRDQAEIPPLRLESTLSFDRQAWLDLG